jgi:hypothetical protein
MQISVLIIKNTIGASPTVFLLKKPPGITGYRSLARIRRVHGLEAHTHYKKYVDL